ncbi:MAG TPA: hypothetical protein VME43_18260 [Bryobacteraceae bacterium]|nr:hypothetical protein [Bryobacteraceae bacterium]
MSETSPSKDPAALWKTQPEEKTQVNLEQIVNRRTGELYASTRSEILMSIGAAVLLVGVTVLRFGPSGNLLEQIACALVVVWVAVTSYRMRARIWRPPARPDAAAVTGAEYYRRELERRRDHLRDAWLWHGPLFLACLILVAIWRGSPFGIGISIARPIDRVMPLVVALALWTGYGIWRRYRQAREIQREIDEMQRE